MEARFRSDGTRIVENFLEKTHMEITLEVYQAAVERGTDEESACAYGCNVADNFIRLYLRSSEAK